MPRLKDALELRGRYGCLVTLPIVWSIPAKKLNPRQWRLSSHPNPMPNVPADPLTLAKRHFTGAILADRRKSVQV